MTLERPQEHVEEEPVQSNASIAGHPIHPMLIPFPITFLVTALITDVAYYTTTDPFWARVSLWLIGAGIVSGLLAGIFGAIDYFSIPRVRAHSAGNIHAIGNVTALTLSLINFLIRLGDPADGVVWTGLLLSLVVSGILAITGWYGGELSYRHKIGVTPVTERERRASDQARGARKA